MKDYSNYTAADLFLDEEFILYIKAGTQSEFWTQLAASDQKLNREMQIAALWVRMLKKPAAADNTAAKEQSWQAVLQQTKQQAIVRRMKRPWLRAAAACIGAALLSTAIYVIHDRSINNRIATTYGQRQHILLPDSSSIELFGHSSIKYGKEKTGREIWLTKGDAQFSIQHTTYKGQQAPEPFKVHFSHYTVTVLGTKFLISTRNNRFQVQLLEGKVRIDDDNAPAATHILRPGESFETDAHTEKARQYTTDSTLSQDWERSELSLDGKSVADVLDYIQNVFGYEIKCDSPDLLNIKLNGKLPSQNLDLILLALGKMTDANIERTHSTIIIHTKN